MQIMRIEVSALWPIAAVARYCSVHSKLAVVDNGKLHFEHRRGGTMGRCRTFRLVDNQSSDEKKVH